jgi:hypothetical protein
MHLLIINMLLIIIAAPVIAESDNNCGGYEKCVIDIYASSDITFLKEVHLCKQQHTNIASCNKKDIYVLIEAYDHARGDNRGITNVMRAKNEKGGEIKQ